MLEEVVLKKAVETGTVAGVMSIFSWLLLKRQNQLVDGHQKFISEQLEKSHERESKLFEQINFLTREIKALSLSIESHSKVSEQKDSYLLLAVEKLAKKVTFISGKEKVN